MADDPAVEKDGHDKDLPCESGVLFPYSGGLHMDGPSRIGNLGSKKEEKVKKEKQKKGRAKKKT